MRFAPGQEVTPNTQDFKIISVSEEIPIYPEFGKVYIVEGYNPNILCGHGRPVFYLKEFPPTHIFCETSFDPLPKLKMCDLPAGISTSTQKTMSKKHVADSTRYLRPLKTTPEDEAPKKKWYPPKSLFRNPNECPRCKGTGKVHDLKSGLERGCTCCGGEGILSRK